MNLLMMTLGTAKEEVRESKNKLVNDDLLEAWPSCSLKELKLRRK